MFKKLTLALSISLLPSTVLATGLSVSPARLDFEATDGRNAIQTLTVMNPTADVLVFEVYPDEFEDIIKASPESFTLESGGRKQVEISADTKNFHQSQLRRTVEEPTASSASISTNLSVVGNPLAESKVNVAAGAKIPVTINIMANKKPAANKTALIVISAASLLIAAFYLGRRTKQTPNIY